jgi:hypothetical protein
MIEVKVTGIPDLRAALAGIVPKLRVKALGQALRAGAALVRDEARRKAPVISASDPKVLLGYRKPGTLRKAIVVRRSRTAARQGDVGVFVNVRPAKGAKYRTDRSGMLGMRVKTQVRASQRGAKSPNDPYYWRFVNWPRTLRNGTVRPGLQFLEAGAARLDDALRVFIAKIGPAIEKLNRPKAPAP